MSKREKSIELLNKAVADELLAVHQYMYFHFGRSVYTKIYRLHNQS